MRTTLVTHSCNQCGVFITDYARAFVAFRDAMQRQQMPPLARFCLHPWREDVAASHQARHLCSKKCALADETEWLVTEAVAPEQVPEAKAAHEQQNA